MSRRGARSSGSGGGVDVKQNVFHSGGRLSRPGLVAGTLVLSARQKARARSLAGTLVLSGVRARSLAGTLVLSGALAAISLLSPGARAAEGDEAHRLFVEGRDALERGDQTTACARFRSSLALARVANTLFNVARCDERDGELALALQGWREGVLLLAAGDDRLAVAKERLAALEARVPMITLVHSSDLPAGARILVDGAAVAMPAPGTPLPLDPGEHTIVVEAPGRAAARFAVTLAERDRKEVAVAAGAVQSKGEPGPEPTQGVKPPPPPPPPPGGSEARRTAGLIAGAVGLVGLAGFAVTGGLLLERDGRIRAACPDKVCSPEGRELIDGGMPLMVANAVALGVGVAGVGLGAGLLLTSRTDSGPRAVLAPAAFLGGGGATIRGAF